MSTLPEAYRAYDAFTRRHVDPRVHPIQCNPQATRRRTSDGSQLPSGAVPRQSARHIRELGPDRESNDSTAFGRQRAVFATDDPVWAMWFALLNRGPGFRSTRNGACSIRGARHYRHYFFFQSPDQPDEHLLTEGWLYVFPRAGFATEPPIAGLLQSGQWVNPNPVRPLARIAAAPTDFPFTHTIARHAAGSATV